ADITVVTRVEGDLVHAVSIGGLDATGMAAVRSLYPMRVSDTDGGMTTRAIRERAIVHTPDASSTLPNPVYRAAGQGSGNRVLLTVPMMPPDGRVLGTINVGRATAGVFSDREIERLETLATQAVIALENVRLFHEVQARNHELSATLAEQTATNHVLGVMA